MLERYRDAVASVRGDVRAYVVRYFGMPARSRRNLFDLCRAHGLSQADVVLALLRARRDEAEAAAERIVGKPILRLPPQRRGYVAALVRPRSGDQRLVLRFVVGDTTLKGTPVLKGAPLYDRLSVIRPGMSVFACLARGARRKDLRLAERRGWLQLERA